MTCDSTRQGSVVESPGLVPVGALSLTPGSRRRVGAAGQPDDGFHSSLRL